VPYITNGGGGAGLYAVDTTNTGAYRHVVKAISEYQYMTFDINDKTLTMNSYTSKKADGTRLSGTSLAANTNTVSALIETVILKHFSDISAQVSVTTDNFVYSRATKLYTGILTVTNNGTTDLSGNVDVVLNDLTTGVTLANATGLYQATPYVAASTTGLPAGASITVPVSFTNPTNVKINFTPATFQE
jgi:hypothetical protein